VEEEGLVPPPRLHRQRRRATGLIVGGIVGATLLQVLAGLFDPPAQFPAIPLTGVLAFVGAICLGLLVAVAIADRALRRLGVLSALRER